MAAFKESSRTGGFVKLDNAYERKSAMRDEEIRSIQ